MDQDLAVQKSLQSINDSLGGLTPRQYSIIGNNLYYLYAIGYETANREKKTRKAVIRIDHKGTELRFDSVSDAARSIGVTKDRVINVCKNRYKQWLGYKFRYEKEETN